MSAASSTTKTDGAYEGAQRSESPPNGSGTNASRTINVAVSSRALFNVEEEHNVFVNEGLERYIELQVSREDEPMEPGPAFPFVKALQNVNDKLKEKDPEEKELFVITLMSRDNAQVGIRLPKSIRHHDLDITRMALTSGTSVVEYLKAYNITLLLTLHEDEVPEAILKGFPAAQMFHVEPVNSRSETQLRIAFDLDVVLFSEDSERIYKEKGLDAYLKHEKENRNNPIPEGPLKPFVEAIGRMEKKFDRSNTKSCPIRTYIVTSRDAMVGERAVLTLRHWGLEIDELHFIGDDQYKDATLKTINPHIFFDTEISDISRACSRGVPSGLVNMSMT